MHFPVTLVALVLVAPVLGAPTLVPITKRAGPVKTNSYIVTFKDATSKDAFMGAEPRFTQPGSSVTYDYSIIPAAAMILDNADELARMQRVDGVKSIEPDSIVSINYEGDVDDSKATDLQASLNPSRRSERRSDNGEGVDIYGIDTGIYIQHNCFGGRAFWGETFGGYKDQDGNGHGTHTAGTAVCSDFKPGLDGKAKIYAVKVLNDDGAGNDSDVIAGVEYAMKQAQASGRPSIAVMSLGGSKTESVDSAVRAAIANGLHFVVAAGNYNLPAERFSPADVKEANTIGAVDNDNKKAYFSNFGGTIDVWYYGVNVKSAWIGGPNFTQVLSGTSMSTPGVASILAAYLSRGGNGKTSPADLSKKLQANSKHAVKSESGLPIVGSTDLLAAPF